jgi:hypothetical protein
MLPDDCWYPRTSDHQDHYVDQYDLHIQIGSCIQVIAACRIGSLEMIGTICCTLPTCLYILAGGQSLCADPPASESFFRALHNTRDLQGQGTPDVHTAVSV